jgi:hypothetical protein
MGRGGSPCPPTVDWNIDSAGARVSSCDLIAGSRNLANNLDYPNKSGNDKYRRMKKIYMRTMVNRKTKIKFLSAVIRPIRACPPQALVIRVLLRLA